ncbi:iron-sulfur cluster assembly scaffold protein [Nanoarchaeota archaeon]
MAVMDCVDPTVDHTETKESEIYKKNIIEHYRNPKNTGKLTIYTLRAREVNPVCGDEMEVYAFFENKILKDIKFDAFGCSISIASASMVSEAIKGKSIEKIQTMTKDDVLEILGIKALGATRLKCATLLLNTLKQGLKHE